MRIVDLHCDTILGCWTGKFESLRQHSGHTDLLKMQKGVALCQFFALYIDRDFMDRMSPYEIYCGMLEEYKKQMAENADMILPAYNYDDIMSNKESGKISSILAVEDGVCLEGKLERVQEFYESGVRHIGLLWDFENEIGFPCSADEEAHGKGLKDFGFQVIEEMNRLGMIVDLSHSSKGVFMDAAKASKSPILASHSCARSLCRHHRNLDDEQLKIIGESGGAVGLNFEESFLNDDCSPFTYERAIQHMKHIVSKAGIESLAFGSDADGIDSLGEMVDYSNFPAFIDHMSRYFSSRQIDMITHGNALRVIRDVIK